VCWDNVSNAFYFRLLIVVNSSDKDVVFGILRPQARRCPHRSHRDRRLILWLACLLWR